MGDSDGIVLETLLKKQSISAVLVDSMMKAHLFSPKYRHELGVFVIVATLDQFFPLIRTIRWSMWWNHYARFLIVSPRPDKITSLLDIVTILARAYDVGMLNVQFIDFESDMSVLVTDSNPYTARAPQQWKLRGLLDMDPPFYFFGQLYRKGEDTCEALDFVKTTDLGGYRFEAIIRTKRAIYYILNPDRIPDLPGNIDAAVATSYIISNRWFVYNLEKALNATVVLISSSTFNTRDFDLLLWPNFASEYNLLMNTNRAIYTFDQTPIFVMTQHTPHMTQLEKISSVIDETSRIGMYFVYLITFLFFKFVLHQAVMPSVLNLVRLTCNTGLVKLPNNLAPTIYLACLFTFVITLQAIYTGNLACLLTQTIAHPNVNTKADVAKLGYTIHCHVAFYNALVADPLLDGQVVKIPENESCTDYVLRDSSIACAAVDYDVVAQASRLNLHVSRYPMQTDYTYHVMSPSNPLARRVQDILRRWQEAGLRLMDQKIERFRRELVDDNAVKQNVERRVMNFNDLRFAFVILAIGLSSSLLCFMVELLISYVSSKHAKRRDRVRPIMTSGETRKKCSWCSPLTWKFSGLRLFSKRR